jgi:four helix bundle protein
MATIQRFEDLEIWKKSRELCKRVYPLTFREPIKSDFRIKDQMRGSIGSIMDNIAEGFERASRLEFIHSLSIVKGEVGELKSQLYRCLDNQYMTSELFTEIYNLADQLTKMLTSFIRYLNNTCIKGQKFKNRPGNE